MKVGLPFTVETELGEGLASGLYGSDRRLLVKALANPILQSWQVDNHIGCLGKKLPGGIWVPTGKGGPEIEPKASSLPQRKGEQPVYEGCPVRNGIYFESHGHGRKLYQKGVSMQQRLIQTTAGGKRKRVTRSGFALVLCAPAAVLVLCSWNYPLVLRIMDWTIAVLGLTVVGLLLLRKAARK